MLIDIDWTRFPADGRYIDKSRIKIELDGHDITTKILLDDKWVPAFSARREHVGVYWGNNLHVMIEDSGYRIIHEWNRLDQRKKEIGEGLAIREYASLPSRYGVADNLKQVFKYGSFFIKHETRAFVLEIGWVRKTGQYANGGWRWHKHGPYIGKQKPSREYLYDEPKIKKVLMFYFHEIEVSNA